MGRKKKKSEINIEEQQTRCERQTSKIFISHDTKDKDIAALLCELLKNASNNGLDIFCSSDINGESGIKLGKPWFEDIMSNIFTSSDMICVITDNSIVNPWVLYEAGVGFGDCKNNENKNVIGVLFDIPRKKIQNTPFHNIQNCRYDDESLTKLLVNLVKKIPNLKPTPESVSPHILQFLEKYKKLPKKSLVKSPEDKEEKYIYNIFEELKMMYSRLEKRLDSGSKVYPTYRRNMRIRMNTFKEFNFISNESKNPIIILIFFSLFKERMPWFYELGKEFYYAIKNKNIKEARNIIISIDEIGRRFMHSPLMETLMIEGEDRFFYDELFHVTCNNLHRYIRNEY